MENIRRNITSAVSTSLIRIAGGGFDSSSSSSSAALNIVDVNANGAPNNNAKWLEELEQVATSSVSFPNGSIDSAGDNLDGKPHDVEVRAALILYHRVRSKHLVHRGDGDGNFNGAKKKKGKRKRNQQRLLGGEEATANATTSVGSNTKNEMQDMSFDIISNMGTRRTITSGISLARLLALELESELSPSSSAINNLTNSSSNSNNNNSNNSNKISFSHIQPNSSGILQLTSSHRSKLLHAANRLPCAYCTNWYKGQKGLWWHQLSKHKIQYSIATEVAGNLVNDLAIVPYCNQGQRQTEQTGGRANGGGEEVAKDNGIVDTEGVGGSGEKSGVSSNNIVVAECHDAFDMIKLGKCNEFKALVEQGGFHPTKQLDKNGASVLHWAAGCGQLELVTYLIEICNCCPNQGQRGKRSFGGRTALHWAARNGHLNVVKFLVSACKADIDAKTSDGTTAFCWAAWQGHLDIMKYLHKSGCDIHTPNSFGCNAVLWSAQGTDTSETLAWLMEHGADFGLLNSNGHSAFHKAAQRGSAGVVKWLVNTFLAGSSYHGIDWTIFIRPDTEGNCPSDLCGMEHGHKSLACWISRRECDCVGRVISFTTTIDELMDRDCIPSWLEQDLHTVKACRNKTTDIVNTSTEWGAGCGVRRMALHVVKRYIKSSTQSESGKATNLHDID